MLEVSHDEVVEARTTRWRVWFLVALVVLLSGLAILWKRTRDQNDPLYQGKRLSEYLYDGYQPFIFPPGTRTSSQAIAQLEAARKEKREDAEGALRSLGPRAVPLILAWMSESPKCLRVRLSRLGAANYQQWGWLLKSRWLSTRRELLAFEAAKLIPQHCEPLAPVLSQQIVDQQPRDALGLLDRIVANVPRARREKILKDNWRVIEFALAEVSREGGSAFGIFILNQLYVYLSGEDRELLLGRLMPLRSRPGVFAIMRSVDPSGAVRHLDYLGNEPIFRKMQAARFFTEKPLMPELVVPRLVKNLATDDEALLKQVLFALASYGTNAAAALPAIQRFAQEQSQPLAADAANVMARIRVPRTVGADMP